MDSPPRRPDISGRAGGEAAEGRAREPSDPEDPLGTGVWSVAGSAGRSGIAPDEVDEASRTYWEAEADVYQAEHGAFLAGSGRWVADQQEEAAAAAGAGAGFLWGPEGLTEAELGMLGPLQALRGQRVLEVGCGAAQCSAWLAAGGIRAVGVDLALNQVRHARQWVGSPDPSCHPSGGKAAPEMTSGRGVGGGGAAEGVLHVVVATATALPFADASFAAAFSAYGAVQFVADLPTLLAEVRRVLVPGGRWVLSVTHPVRWAFPDDPGPAGLTATGSYFDRRPYVERDETGAAVYAEFHRTLGDYVAALVAAGFGIEAMVEPEWPDWNEQVWGGWSPERGTHLPGTLIIGCRAGA